MVLKTKVPVPLLTESDIRRFWSKVQRQGPNDCWPWLAYCDRDGYGRFYVDGVVFRAHRVANAVSNGDTSLDTTHSCDNPPCCNPAHLRPGTQQTNMAEMEARGRRVNSPHLGEAHGRHKLTAQEVRQIRGTVGVTQKELAVKYGISRNHVYNLRSNHFWKHIAKVNK